MKKLVLFLMLAACAGTVERSPGTEKLTQLNDEPVGCRLLYRLEVEADVRRKDDAVRFLENKIVEQPRDGNAYWVTSVRTIPRKWTFFGAEHSYVIAANVYRCPEHGRFVTRSDVEEASDYQLRRR